MKMLVVNDAQKIILSHGQSLGAEYVALDKSLGRVLCQNLYADRDQPAVTCSSMDGIAIAYSGWKRGLRRFKIAGLQKAGTLALALPNDQCAIEIMTGASLPAHADTIIPVEHFKFKGKEVVVKKDLIISRGDYLRMQGRDYRKGKILLSKGDRITPQHVAVAASVGQSRLKVNSNPRIALIGTGDELVPIEQTPQVFQARQSNTYGLESILAQEGFLNTRRYHFPDHVRTLRRGLKTAMANSDVLVLSGGVSKGKFDYVPAVLQELGVKILFHTVKQRPGKPFAFGRTAKGQPVFALPGNPVSTQVCAVRYLIPYLKKSVGIPLADEQVHFNEKMIGSADLVHFLPVTIEMKEGYRLAKSVPFSGSGDYAALTASDGFIEFDPRNSSKIKMVKFFSWAKR